MAAKKTRVVVGPVVVLPQESTGLVGYYYQGSTLPDGLVEERVQSAIADGLVSEEVDVTALTIDDLSVAAAGDRLRAAGADAAAVPVTSERPKATATKPAWAEFRGLTEEQAKDLTLDQLKDDAFMASHPAQPAA